MCLLLVIFLKFFSIRKKSVVLFVPKFSSFYSKIIRFFIQKKEELLENSCFWIFYFSQVKIFLPAIFLKLIFNQKKKSGFIWPETFVFSFKNIRIFIQKKELHLEIAVPGFLNFNKIFEK